jgi:hypothetical protein
MTSYYLLVQTVTTVRLRSNILLARLFANQQIDAFDAFEDGLPVERDGGYLVNIPMEKPESWKWLLCKMLPNLKYGLVFAMGKLYPRSVPTSPIYKQLTLVRAKFLFVLNIV